MKKKIIYNKNFDKNKIRNIIEWVINNYGNLKAYKLLDKIKRVGLKYSTKAGISLGTEDLIIPKTKKILINKTDKELKKEKRKLKIGKINENEFLNNFIFKWNSTSNLLTKEIVKNFKETNILNPVYIMIISGARGNLSQIKQIIGFRGLISDSEGKIIKSPIKTNLKEGLTKEEYFISCYGARKGIIDTGLKTANSGYLTRRLIYSAQNIIIKQPDCKTTTGSIIKIKTNNKENYFKSINKLIGRVINETINLENFKFKIFKGQDLCKYLIKKITKHRKYILIRKIINCKINVGTCQLCYGWDLTTNKLVKLGEAVGILAAQSIGEPGTQLTMRTFHTGGIFKSKEIKIIQTPIKGIIKYNNKNIIKIKNTYLKGFLIKNKKAIFIKNNNFIKKINLPKYSIILSKTNKKIYKNQIIIQMPSLKEETRPKGVIKNFSTIKTKNDGLFIINFLKKKKKIIWIINGKIENNFYNLKKDTNKNLINFNKKLTLKNKINKINETRVKPLLNFKSYKKIKHIKNKNDIIIKINKIIRKRKKNKILLFSDRNIKNSSNKKLSTGMLIIKNKKFKAQIIETIYEKKQINVFKNGSVFLATTNSKIESKNNNIIEKNSKIIKINYFTEKTNDIVEGLPKVEEILEAKKTQNSILITNNVYTNLKNIYTNFKKKYPDSISVRKALIKIQENLTRNIIKVYSLQNVTIAEKHIEIIIKQMTSKVLITQSENKNLLIGEIMDLNKIEKINIENKIKYEPMVIGISQVPITSESFISATCFQETTRILIKSAIIGKIDWLKGLKENIIIGKLIPAGTGYSFKNKQF